MWNRLSSVIVVSVIAILTTVSPGNAQFRVCNKAKEKIDVAFGYDGGRQGFIAEGWWALAVNQCATVMSGALGLRYYYVYGKGYDGTKWDGSDDRNPGSFCVKYEKFTLYQRHYGDNEQADCKKAGLDSKSFFRVDVGEYRSWTQTLDAGRTAAPPPNRPNPPLNRPTPSPDRPNPPPVGGGGGGGNACQRFPNLC